MKLYDNISGALLMQMNKEVKMMRKGIIPDFGTLTKEHFYTENEMCEMLGVTHRTLRTYRKNNLLGYIKIAGRILYLKYLFALDLLSAHKESSKDD